MNDQWYFVDHTLFDQIAKMSEESEGEIAAPSKEDIDAIVVAFGQVNREYIFTDDPGKAVLVRKQDVGREKLNDRGADYPTKKEMPDGAPVMVDGRREWVSIRNIDNSADDFGTIGEAFERDTGLARIGPVGRGTARLMPQRPLVDFAPG